MIVVCYKIINSFEITVDKKKKIYNMNIFISWI